MSGNGDYISREAALDAISEWLMKALHPENTSSYNEGERAAYRTTLSEIAELPAADVRPVKRGKWKERRFSEDVYGAECSVCHTTWDYGTNFCPNCGADMREES